MRPVAGVTNESFDAQGRGGLTRSASHEREIRRQPLPHPVAHNHPFHLRRARFMVPSQRPGGHGGAVDDAQRGRRRGRRRAHRRARTNLTGRPAALAALFASLMGRRSSAAKYVDPGHSPSIQTTPNVCRAA